MPTADWEEPHNKFLVMSLSENRDEQSHRLLIIFNAGRQDVEFSFPVSACSWRRLIDTAIPGQDKEAVITTETTTIYCQSVAVFSNT